MTTIKDREFIPLYRLIRNKYGKIIKILPYDFNNLSDEDLYELWKQYGRFRAVALPDDPVPQCGWKCLSTTHLYRLFGKKDPFLRCCMIHDIEYGLKRKERAVVDKELYTCMCKVAGWNPALRSVAVIYYGIVRATGGLFW